MADEERNRRERGGISVRKKKQMQRCENINHQNSCLGAQSGEHSEVPAQTEEKNTRAHEVPRLRLGQHRVERRRRSLDVKVVRSANTQNK